MRVRVNDDEGRWDSAAMMLIAANATLWAIGVIMLCVTNAAVHEGQLCIVIAAVMTALLIIRSWLFRLGRAFVHGYHAGWHDASARECYPAEDCDVMDLAAVRARRS